MGLHHKLDRSELLPGPQLRHPDDSVEGQLWEQMHGHKGTKSSTRTNTCSNRLERIQFEDYAPVSLAGYKTCHDFVGSHIATMLE